jgi:pyruvate carboxylase subunit B
MKKRVAVMNTAFRDGFQSVFGARVFTKDFLPALEAACDAGFTHFEAGGGARYQALYLYCRESAFDMMDAFRETAGPDANLQTLSRGVNVVGLDSQSSDIIDLHAKMFKKHGMTTIRNFDALNDVRNLIYSGQCIVNAGLKHEVVVTMMELPPGVEGAHTPDFYMGVLREILDNDVPYDSVCFKDASGTAAPQKVHDTIKAARKMLPEGTHLRVHSHETAGTSVLMYKAALEAGCDGIDLSMAPVSGGTAQPDVVTMWHALRGTEFDLDLDINKVLEVEEIFKECMKDYFVPPEALAVEPLIPFSPMPGGALTANTQMMRDNGIMDRYPKVIAKMGEVVMRGGFGTSVTPVSQFYFQQAFNNEMFGDWKRIADGYGKMVLGYFGQTPVPPDPEIVALAAEQLGLEPTTRNPREINDEDPRKGIDPAKALLEAEGLPVNDENIFIAATCADKGIAFLKGDGPLGVRKIDPNAGAPAAAPAAAEGPLAVTVNGRTFDVSFDGDQAIVDGKSYAFEVAPKEGGAGAASGSGSATHEVKAELAAKVFKIVVSQGQQVEEGDTLLVLEALKMEIPVSAPAAGVVANLAVEVGQQVGPGDLLVGLA